MRFYRLRVWWSAAKHRILCRYSESFRDHDKLIRQLGEARRERSSMESFLNKATAEVESLKGQLALATEAQQNASRQLIAERALRDRAEEKADQYHAELVESLKDHTNWLARGRFGQPVHGSLLKTEEAPKIPVPLPTKRMAREVAREVEEATMEDFLARLQEDLHQREMHEGPEMVTPV